MSTFPGAGVTCVSKIKVTERQKLPENDAYLGECLLMAHRASTLVCSGYQADGLIHAGTRRGDIFARTLLVQLTKLN